MAEDESGQSTESEIDWDEIHERSIKKAFETKAREPWVWETQAFTLKRASEIVHGYAVIANSRNTQRLLDKLADPPAPGSSTGRYLTDVEMADHLDASLSYSAEMLLGLALENLLKGILLRQNPNLLTEEGELKTKSHNLYDLWKRAGLDLDEDRTALLQMLTKSVEWSGKYFVPLTEEAYLKGAGIGFPRKNTSLAPFEDFYQQALELWEYCHDHFKS